MKGELLNGTDTPQIRKFPESQLQSTADAKSARHDAKRRPGKRRLLYTCLLYTSSGSMNACRNDGGIITTPYGSYVIVMLNKDFSDKQYYPDHPATVFGSRVSRLIFDQYLTLEGRLK